ncbi:MAG: serine/threonine protein kinase [Deltaproteobacteria bacterium]|nr:serine/threonine protein kinase [Deltaproteobacteria bacterium]
MPGELLEGKYQIREPIGEGGMGVVYEAEHVALGLVVAVKVLHPTEPNAPHVIERFKTEARSAANIRHPNVVEVTDFGLTPDLRPFFVMEYLSGESLAQRLERDEQLHERAAVEVADQILSGLSIAHVSGVIHRDLKPENVFLAKTAGLGETVKLLDFGVARIIGGDDAGPVDGAPAPVRTAADGKPLTQRGIVLGTPGYLAPENVRGAPADLRTDLFSVGVILYEMLVGRRPFRGDTVDEIITATLTKPIPSPRALRPDLTPAMERLVLTALAKNPDDRFQTAEEYLNHLSAAAVGRVPEHARPCVTEIGSPSIIPSPGEILPLKTGDQESIETLDSIPTSDPPAGAAMPAPTPSPSPAAPWSDPTSKDEATTPHAKSRSRRMMLVIAGVAAVVLVGLALLAVHLLDDDHGPPDDAQSNDPRARSEGDPGGTAGQYTGETVTIWLEVSPLAATITWDGRLVTDSPLVVPHGTRETELLISHPGYLPERLMLQPDRERSVRVNLHRLP